MAEASTKAHEFSWLATMDPATTNISIAVTRLSRTADPPSTVGAIGWTMSSNFLLLNGWDI